MGIAPSMLLIINLDSSAAHTGRQGRVFDNVRTWIKNELPWSIEFYHYEVVLLNNLREVSIVQDEYVSLFFIGENCCCQKYN